MSSKRAYSTDELIFLLKQKDEKAFTYLYDIYHESLCISLKGLIKDKELIRDIVQEGFIQIWKSIDQYRMDCGIYHWMKTVVKYTAIKIIKREQRRGFIEKNSILNRNEADTSAMERTDCIGVKEMVSSLSRNYRQIINMRYFQEYTYKEIGLPSDIAKHRHELALDRLKELYNVPFEKKPKEKKPIKLKEKKAKEKKYNIPLTYQSSLTWSEKCLYFLSTGEAMSVGNIFKKVSEIEPNMSYVKALKVKSNISSILLGFIENKIVKVVEPKKIDNTEGRKVVIVQKELQP